MPYHWPNTNDSLINCLIFHPLASPIHGINKLCGDKQDVDIPIDTMAALCPRLEKLVNENVITLEQANQIILTKKLPVELAHYIGLYAHSGQNGLDMTSSHNIGVIGGPSLMNKFYGGYSGSGFNSPNHLAHLGNSVSPNPTIGNSFSASNSQNFSTGFGGNFVLNSLAGSNSACPSPILNYSLSGTSSPNPYINTASSSPLHQITKGISGLTTGGGSITRGTSAALENAVAVSNQPLDLSMDAYATNNEMVCITQSCTSPAMGGNWFVPAQFYDLKPLNLSPAQPVRIVPTPPSSPNLCIIQEEISNSTSPSSLATVAHFDDAPCSHPQISVTDVQGSEVTLVALSDNSHDSEDSLDAHNPIAMQGLMITEPSTDMPSITRGVGRKSSLEIENRQENYERRGSDKSLGFSDDSLSNDSNILSPGQEPSGSSGFKSGDSHSEMTEARLSPDSLSDSRRMSEECYELPLPHECYNLDSSRIIEIVKQTIDSKLPPKCFVVHRMDEQEASSGTSGAGAFGCSSSSGSDVTFALDVSNLSLEYSGGLQIELQVCGGGSKDNCNKGIKLRRISGDQFEYGKLCQQLISSLTV